ncbi:MAG: fructosamine kinase family protein [Treponemataceae bacterium]|nr:fructosamine kinase family protein [Treponemataceae bacterium]
MKTSLPPNYPSLASALVSLFGTSVAIAHTDRVSGGDINKAYAVTLNTGDCVFMKANEKDKVSFFTAEAAGLAALAETGAIGTPQVLCTGTDDGEYVGYSFLLLKFIKSGKQRADYWELFASELAALHRADTKFIMESGAPASPAKGSAKTAAASVSAASAHETGAIPGAAPANPANSSPGTLAFGFFQDNFIGATPQCNSPKASWLDFFRENRLAPQFKATDSYFSEADRALNTKLLDHLEDFLLEPDKPSLLHGDLWSGNVMCGPEGKAMLIDPATYIGHAEADLAMTELFGGFPPKFYQAYKEVNPLQPGYESRRDLYNLYQLLNHLNLFGAGYLGAVRSVVSEYVGG